MGLLLLIAGWFIYSIIQGKSSWHREMTRDMQRKIHNEYYGDKVVKYIGNYAYHTDGSFHFVGKQK